MIRKVGEVRMKKKKLKKEIKTLKNDMNQVCKQILVISETIAKHQCHCENYKPKTVEFKRFIPLPKMFGEETSTL